MVLYATNSPARLLHTNCVVFFTAFYFPMSKMVIYMMVSESSLHLRIWLQQPLLPLSLLLPFLLLPSPPFYLLPPPPSLPVIWYDQEPLPPPGPYHARPTTGLPQRLLRNTSTRALNCDCCCGEGDYWCVRQLSEAY